MSLSTIYIVGSKSIKMEEATRWEMRSLGTIQTVGSENSKMEEENRREDYVTQHKLIHIVGSKSIKMEEAARWENDVTQNNSHSCFQN